ncbi:hypothetical protein [Allopontixanthobacter sp.]|uniref:hypothetical protein n=1 Tax=Allopontixanthobacter sp. TaxID=2906452 RepID=UPI002ABCD642|nr:hypothetical protein [Allopontixanthobacter sp.]MDZ4308411.1 hypothetical protein [Allopontixanthobacter sp.]
MKAVKRAIAAQLRLAAEWVGTRYIPVECFGYEIIGWTHNDIGGDSAIYRWHFSEAERAPFYEHNRRIDHWGIWLRRLAARLENRPRSPAARVDPGSVDVG